MLFGVVAKNFQKGGAVQLKKTYWVGQEKKVASFKRKLAENNRQADETASQSNN